jgi:anti-sigma B factor antagonist
MNSGSNLGISVDRLENHARVLLDGRVNVDSSPDLRDQLLGILSAAPVPRTVTVDLSGVSYIETSGIATLIEALRFARHRQIGFCLQGLGGSVLRLFEVTGTLMLFDHDDRGKGVS